jgi:hypothetical protein
MSATSHPMPEQPKNMLKRKIAPELWWPRTDAIVEGRK